MKALLPGAAVVALLSSTSLALAADPEGPPPPPPPAAAPAPEASPSPAPGEEPPAPRVAAPEPATEKHTDEPVYVRDHRTVKSFPVNLGHNILEVWSRDSIPPLLIGTAGTVAAFMVDNDTVTYFDRHEWKRYGDWGAIIGTGVTAGAVSGIVFGIGRYANGDRFRAGAYDMGQAVIVNFLYTTAIKEAVRRPRPDKGDNLSFPSGHASNAFACAAVWETQYGWKAGIPGYAAATWIAGSRLAKHKHHVSDVVAGAALGYIVGKSVSRYDSQPSRKLAPGEKVKVGFFPDSGPDGSGVGLRLSVVF